MPTKKLTRFNELMRMHVEDTCNRLGLTREQLAKKIGITRDALHVAMRKPTGMGHDTAKRFAKVAALDETETQRLMHAWVLERQTKGRNGGPFRVVWRWVERKATKKEFEKLRSEMIVAYDEWKASDDQPV